MGSVRRSNSASRSQTTSNWEVLLELDVHGGGPLHSRLRNALLAAIQNGRLPPGTALPPSRKLADDLTCSRWVVTEVYGQLIAQGYLEGRPGSGTRVAWSDRTAPQPAAAAQASVPVPRLDLAPGLPDLRAFPCKEWVAAIRAEAQSIAPSDLGYQAPGGHPRLRLALADYLRRVRCAHAAAEDVIVCTGITDGLMRVCRALASAGLGAVAVEDPTWPRLRRAVATCGLAPVPLVVDEEGLRIADLAAHPEVRAVVVAPAHQYPTGALLAPARRAALLDWVRRVNGVVIEDDCDAEFRYDRPPVSALQGMDPGRVVLLGSLSKRLSPAVGVGWMVVPEGWIDAVHEQSAPTPGPSTLDQLAIARLIETGSLDRHLRRARQRYRARRDALVAALERELPRCCVSGIEAGTHLLLTLPEGTDESAVVFEAMARGVRVWALGRHRLLGAPAAPGLVIGYGNLPLGRADEAARELAAVIARANSRAVLN
jgi:GntR family transcriptional regulator / MocR family aminotransferase